MSISPVLDSAILIAALSLLMSPFLAIIGKNNRGRGGKEDKEILAKWKNIQGHSINIFNFCKIT
jgi:hypothetical protein